MPFGNIAFHSSSSNLPSALMSFKGLLLLREKERERERKEFGGHLPVAFSERDIFVLRSVRSDVGIKNCRNYFKSWPKISHCSQTEKVMVFRTTQKGIQTFGLLLYIKFVPKKFQKNPIWSHWSYCLLVSRPVHLL